MTDKEINLCQSKQKPSKREPTDADSSHRPKPRMITTTEKWQFDKEVLDDIAQLEYIEKLHTELENKSTAYSILRQQIQQKLSGYRQQDIKKRMFVENKFANLGYVVGLLKTCKNQCFYCKKSVQVLYKHVREPKQWSLDRIDNSAGHNVDNVMIACLECNLRRKTMYHERFAFTKQLTISRTDT